MGVPRPTALAQRDVAPAGEPGAAAVQRHGRGGDPRPMTSATTVAQPGDMTVPLLFGWEGIAVAVTVVLVVGAVAFLMLAAGRGASGRSDWQAWLDARSASPLEETAPPSEAVGRSPYRNN
jgi:hypothetical protein